MKCSLRYAIAMAVVIGVFAWQRSWSAQQPAPTPPPQLVKNVSIDDLSNGKLADNVYVKVKVQLKSMQADIFAPTVKKMMGPQGQVTPVEETNHLILFDTVVNLRDIVKIINRGEIWGDPGPSNSLIYKCQFVRAAAAAEKLKDILSNPNAVAGNPNVAQPPGKNGRRPKPHTIAHDDGTNYVFVTGPPDKIVLAQAILAKIDVPEKVPPSKTPQGPPHLATYPVPAGKAEPTAKVLQAIFKSSASLRINAVGTTQIMVYAPVADQMDIDGLLKGALATEGVAGVFVLEKADANKVAGLALDKLSKDRAAPLIRSNVSDNSIVVYGSPNQVEAVRHMIESLSGEKVQASQEQKGEQP